MDTAWLAMVKMIKVRCLLILILVFCPSVVLKTSGKSLYSGMSKVESHTTQPVSTCPNLSQPVPTCPNLPQSAPTCPNLPKPVPTCPNLSGPKMSCTEIKVTQLSSRQALGRWGLPQFLMLRKYFLVVGCFCFCFIFLLGSLKVGIWEHLDTCSNPNATLGM